MQKSHSFSLFNVFSFGRETNSMVEEFMLLANISVAKKIHEEFSEHALLRKHPAPPPSNYEILVKAAKSKVWFHSQKHYLYSCCDVVFALNNLQSQFHKSFVSSCKNVPVILFPVRHSVAVSHSSIEAAAAKIITYQQISYALFFQQLKQILLL